MATSEVLTMVPYITSIITARRFAWVGKVYGARDEIDPGVVYGNKSPGRSDRETM